MHPSEVKATLRQSIKERMAHLSDADRHAESRTICRQIRKVLPSSPVPVAAYFPLKDEADLRPLLDELLKEGWPVYIPGIEHGQMIFRKITSTADLHLGKFGVLEPPRSAEALDPKTLKIVLVPGRAFDVLGNRLGRGNSTYDKWITAQRKANPSTQFWGIALECQIIHEVPMQEHDERMDSVITARGQTAVA